MLASPVLHKSAIRCFMLLLGGVRLVYRKAPASPHYCGSGEIGELYWFRSASKILSSIGLNRFLLSATSLLVL